MSRQARRSFPLAKVYRLLEPGPVVMVTTVRDDRPNVMTQSWHTMLDFEPPLVASVISDRSHTFATLQATRECVINIPTVEVAPQAVACGNTSGRKIDKFSKFHLTALPASRVGAPLVAECFANLECKVIDTRMARKYNLFVLEVLAAWIDPSRKNPKTIHHLGQGAFMVAGRTIVLPSRMR